MGERARRQAEENARLNERAEMDQERARLAAREAELNRRTYELNQFQGGMPQLGPRNGYDFNDHQMGGYRGHEDYQLNRPIGDYGGRGNGNVGRGGGWNYEGGFDNGPSGRGFAPRGRGGFRGNAPRGRGGRGRGPVDRRDLAPRGQGRGRGETPKPAEQGSGMDLDPKDGQ
jgi:hypothetical protein